MAFTNPPNSVTFPAGAVTGQSRMVVGADTPPELQLYGIDQAILAYVTDVVTGVERGYFFIGSSNRMDGFSDSRAMVYGNVTYPTPGVPSSATMSDVYTNFQQDMFAQYPDTIFKDQRVRFWTDISLEPANGMTSFQIGGKNVQWCIAEGTGEASGTTNANAVAQLIAGTLVTLGNISATNDYAVCRATVDFIQTTASATTAVVELMVNGAAVPRQAIFSGVTAGVRITSTQQWRVPMTSINAGHTFQLRITKAAGTDGHVQALATHTNLYVQMMTDI